MPNWVYNSMNVAGKTSDIKEFIEKAKKPRPDGFEKDEIAYVENDGLSFFNFVAPPVEAIESGEYFGTNGYVNGEAVGKTEFNWYEWNIANWGVKWDAGSVSAGTHIDETKPTNAISYSFETAWGIPEPVFQAMITQHPNLEFDFSCEEEQGWGAEFESSEGSLVTTKEWGIPESHADYAERDNLDGCQCAWDEDPHDWYPDCEDREALLADYHNDNPDQKCECVIVSAQEPDVIY